MCVFYLVFLVLIDEITGFHVFVVIFLGFFSFKNYFFFGKNLTKSTEPHFFSFRVSPFILERERLFFTHFLRNGLRRRRGDDLIFTARAGIDDVTRIERSVFRNVQNDRRPQRGRRTNSIFSNRNRENKFPISL